MIQNLGRLALRAVTVARHFSVTAVVLTTTASMQQANAAPQINGCSGNWTSVVSSLQPTKAGPMSLASLQCLLLPHSSFPVSPPSLSDDGRQFLAFDWMNGLWIGGASPSSEPHQFPGHVLSFSLLSPSIPFTWSSNPGTALGVRQDTVKPSGWALSQLQPVLFSGDGDQRDLPAIVHPNGTLDELYWVGKDGLALVGFGTRGQFYRPQHTDPRPAIALVDVRSGTVLQATDLKDIPGLGDAKDIETVTARVDPHGIAHVLVSWGAGKWVSWVQGDRPHVVPLRSDASLSTLSADGTKVLLMGNLSATGPICELTDPCPEPTPKSGMVAELVDVETGGVVWSISGTAANLTRSNLPAVSPDGKLALISLPGEGKRPITALVSMDDGHVIQEIQTPPWGGQLGLGFSADSKKTWISGGATIAVFDIAND